MQVNKQDQLASKSTELSEPRGEQLNDNQVKQVNELEKLNHVKQKKQVNKVNSL